MRRMKAPSTAVMMPAIVAPLSPFGVELSSVNDSAGGVGATDVGEVLEGSIFDEILEVADVLELLEVVELAGKCTVSIAVGTEAVTVMAAPDIGILMLVAVVAEVDGVGGA